MTEAAYSPALLNVDKCIKTGIKNAVRYLRDKCGATISNVSRYTILYALTNSTKLFGLFLLHLMVHIHSDGNDEHIHDEDLASNILQILK